MTRSIGIGTGVVLILLVCIGIAAYAIYGYQNGGGSGLGTGRTGAGAHILLDMNELVAKSDLVVVGTAGSGQTVTKTVADTSEPENQREADYDLKVNEVPFTVSEYLKGDGEGTITVTLAEDAPGQRMTDDQVEDGVKYVLFLFDASALTDSTIWDGTYLSVGEQGIWRVSGDSVVRLEPPRTMQLSELKNAVKQAVSGG